jgi:hypothetical protein
MLLQVSHVCMSGTIVDPSRYLEELRRQRQVDLTCGSQVLRTEFCWSGIAADDCLLFRRITRRMGEKMANVFPS